MHDSLESTVKSKMTLLEEAQQKVKDLETLLETTKDRCDQETQKVKDKYALKNKDLVYQNEINHKKFSILEQQLVSMQEETKTTMFKINEANVEHELAKKSLETVTASYTEVGASLNDWQMRLKVKTMHLLFYE